MRQVASQVCYYYIFLKMIKKITLHFDLFSIAEEGFGLKFVQFLLEDTTNFKYLNDIKFEKPLNASTCILSPKECEKELSQIKAGQNSKAI